MLSTVERNAGPFAEMAVAGAAHVVEEALGMHPERTMRKDGGDNDSAKSRPGAPSSKRESRTREGYRQGHEGGNRR